jgi:hypothetical protein
MGRRLRFIAWIAVCAMLTIGQAAWLYLIRWPWIFNHDEILIGEQVLLGGACLLMALLLRTTPPDAIRVSRRAGVAVILGGAAMLHVASVALPLPQTMLSQAIMLRGLIAAFAFAVSLVLIDLLRKTGRSIWWSALWAWNPLIILVSGGEYALWTRPMGTFSTALILLEYVTVFTLLSGEIYRTVAKKVYD